MRNMRLIGMTVLLLAGLALPAQATMVSFPDRMTVCNALPPNKTALLAGNCQSYFTVADAAGQKMVDEMVNIVKANQIVSPVDGVNDFRSVKDQVLKALDTFHEAAVLASKTEHTSLKAKMNQAFDQERADFYKAYGVYLSMAEVGVKIHNDYLDLSQEYVSMVKKREQLVKMAKQVSKTYLYLARLASEAKQRPLSQARLKDLEPQVRAMVNLTRAIYRATGHMREEYKKVLVNNNPEGLKAAFDQAGAEKAMEALFASRSHWEPWFSKIKAPLNEYGMKPTVNRYNQYKKRYNDIFGGSMAAVVGNLPPFNKDNPVEAIKASVQWYKGQVGQ